ncbi:transcriptional regulator, partial [Bacteroides thetaiotaomicron]
MDAVILQENIEGLLNLVRMLLPGGGSAGCVYLDDLSALQGSIHEKINDLY